MTDNAALKKVVNAEGTHKGARIEQIRRFERESGYMRRGDFPISGSVKLALELSVSRHPWSS